MPQINKKDTIRSGSGIGLPTGPITVIGDSIPKGLYLQQKRICRIEHSAVDLVAERLGLHVENSSMFGQTLKKCCAKGYFDRWLAERSSPNAQLIISLGGNDCDYVWEEVAKNPPGAHLPHTPLPEFEGLLRTLIATLRAQRVQPVFTALPPIDSARYFRNVICARADGERVMEFFRGDITNIARHQECYNDAVLKAALSGGCTFLDFRSELLLRADYLDLLSDDGIHPNQKGHEAIADCICRRYADKAVSAV